MNMGGPCPDYTYRTTDVDPKGVYRISGYRGTTRFAEIAQQVCERTGSAAVLEGSIASLGSQYVMGLRARTCNASSRGVTRTRRFSG